MRLVYDISTLTPYVNWPYFFFAWQVKDPTEKARLQREAETCLTELEDCYHVYALFEICDANGDGDDIVIGRSRIPLLRQQRPTSVGQPNLCLADYLRPLSSGVKDRLGVFATSVDMGLETDFDNDPYQKMMVQLLADRLAEAAGVSERKAEKDLEIMEMVPRNLYNFHPGSHTGQGTETGIGGNSR